MASSVFTHPGGRFAIIKSGHIAYFNPGNTAEWLKTNVTPPAVATYPPQPLQCNTRSLHMGADATLYMLCDTRLIRLQTEPEEWMPVFDGNTTGGNGGAAVTACASFVPARIGVDAAKATCFAFMGVNTGGGAELMRIDTTNSACVNYEWPHRKSRIVSVAAASASVVYVAEVGGEECDDDGNERNGVVYICRAELVDAMDEKADAEWKVERCMELPETADSANLLWDPCYGTLYVWAAALLQRFNVKTWRAGTKPVWRTPTGVFLQNPDVDVRFVLDLSRMGILVLLPSGKGWDYIAVSPTEEVASLDKRTLMEAVDAQRHTMAEFTDVRVQTDTFEFEDEESTQFEDDDSYAFDEEAEEEEEEEAKDSMRDDEFADAVNTAERNHLENMMDEMCINEEEKRAILRSLYVPVRVPDTLWCTNVPVGTAGAPVFVHAVAVDVGDVPWAVLSDAAGCFSVAQVRSEGELFCRGALPYDAATSGPPIAVAKRGPALVLTNGRDVLVYRQRVDAALGRTDYVEVYKWAGAGASSMADVCLTELPMDASRYMLFVADAGRHCVWRMDFVDNGDDTFTCATNAVCVMGAPDVAGFVDNCGRDDARLREPVALCMDFGLRLFVSDRGNGRVRYVDVLDGSLVHTVLGGGGGDGDAPTDGILTARFGNLAARGLSTDSDIVYVLDGDTVRCSFVGARTDGHKSHKYLCDLRTPGVKCESKEEAHAMTGVLSFASGSMGSPPYVLGKGLFHLATFDPKEAPEKRMRRTLNDHVMQRLGDSDQAQEVADNVFASFGRAYGEAEEEKDETEEDVGGRRVRAKEHVAVGGDVEMTTDEN
jgi:hypothetical protein